jgi:hypothetical protein
MLLINVYHGGQILNISISVSYDIYVSCIFSTDETISIHNLKRQIHVGLKPLPSHFNIIISAWINTARSSTGDFFYNLFGIIFEEIW